MSFITESLLADDPVFPLTESVANNGWTMFDICAMLLYTAKSNGVSNSTLDKFLKVIALVVNRKRCVNDCQKVKKFPANPRAVQRFLKISREENHKIVFICPAQRTVRKKNEDVPVSEICGYTLRLLEGAGPNTYISDLCEAEWDNKLVEKDGNHFAASSIHWLLCNILTKHGKRFSGATEHQSASQVLHDVKDGERWKKMGLQASDLLISVHADGAAISKSTKRKMYLIFLHLLNLPVGPRQNIWPLVLIWVGENLPKDREAFLMELSLQLKNLQIGAENFQPVVWVDKNGETIRSSVYVHTIMSDTPERAALNGQLSHSAAQGCIYCTQVR